MWGNTGFRPEPVTVSRRITPLPAAAKLHVIVSDHADSQLMALVMGIMHPTFRTALRHGAFFSISLEVQLTSSMTNRL
jgi:hypothetical protein